MILTSTVQQSFLRKTSISLRDWHFYILIILAAAITYGKTVEYQFTYVDDVDLVLANQDVLGSISNIPRLFQSDAFLSTTNPQLFYRPLLSLLFMLETLIMKGSPFIFHLTNILLHIVCSILILRILRLVGSSTLVAGIAGLLFCVHPLNSSAVAWIPGCNDLLLAVFVLSSFLFLVKALDAQKSGPLVWHSVLFFLALLTKESAIVLPILTISYVLLFHPDILKKTVWTFAGLAYVLPIVAWFILRSRVPQTFTVHLKSDFFLMSSLSNLPGLFLYVGKIFLPFNLSVFPNLGDHSIVPGIICSVLFLAVCLVWKDESTWKILWGIGWFLMFLLPAFVANFILFEHRAYTALFGFLFALTQLPFVKTMSLSKRAHVIVALVIIGGAALVSIFHSEQYRDRAAYATSAYLADPSVDNSYVNFALLFVAEGKDEDAEHLLRKGLERNQAMNGAHKILGDILARRQDYTEAAKQYDISLRLNPLQLNTYITYGKMCLDAGRIDDASRLWRTSVAINPNFILGYYYLANFYIRVRDYPDSASMYVEQIQRRGEKVLPELLQAIQEDRMRTEGRH